MANKKSSASKRDKRRGFPLLVFLGGVSAAYYLVLRPQLLKWGTQGDEAERPLPGDDLIISPGVKLTHALDIDAPSEVVWAWLTQMGREGTGYYAFDALDNNGIPSANKLRSDLPKIAVGMSLDNDLQVLQVEQGQSLILGAFGVSNFLGAPHDVTYAYSLQKLPHDSTRLICRVRLYAYSLQGLLYNVLVEPALFAWMFAQLNNLRTRSESSKHHAGLNKEKSNGNIRLTTR